MTVCERAIAHPRFRCNYCHAEATLAVEVAPLALRVIHACEEHADDARQDIEQYLEHVRATLRPPIAGFTLGTLGRIAHGKHPTYCSYGYRAVAWELLEERARD